jgi:ribosome-associated toxin RatA of RatAB toxin-antitoxin module
MLKINRSIITSHTAEQMYNLVADIENYKNYLPWCPNSQIIKLIDKETLVARVDISYLKVKAHFSTLNHYTANTRIDMDLVDGPFKHLQGHWNFMPLGELGCKVSFNLEYKFSNIILEKLIGSVFEIIIKNIIDRFVLKAHEIYPKGTTSNHDPD